MSSRTMFAKLWDRHVVRPETASTPAVLYIDLHLVHEVTSPQAFESLRIHGRSVRRPDLTVATYFTSKQYAQENADVVDRFVEAMNKSLTYAQENPDAVREALPEYTQIPKEAAQKINLPSWKPELTEDTIQMLSELSEKYGLIEEQPNLDELIRR